MGKVDGDDSSACANGNVGLYGSIGESDTASAGANGVVDRGGGGGLITMLGSKANNGGASSSSSSSSIAVDDQDDCGFIAHDVYQRQPLLNDQSFSGRSCKDTSNNNYYNGNSCSSNGMVKITIPAAHREEPRFPKERMKTFLAFIFLFCNWLLTTAALALTHERVPDATPLPDIILDNISFHGWGLEVSEILIILSCYVCVVIIIFHKHRLIIFRRVFVLMGLLYFYRSITMYVTVLPVADPNYFCSPKANTTSILIVLKRMVQLLSGFGLSINGQHTFCGDYVYSGHTVCLVMAYLVVREYTPRRWWPVHWLFGLLAILGVVMVLISRGHYTVDCVIAYYITTRLFYVYHTLAENHSLKEGGGNNFFERLWWYPMFLYMERNVQGVVPRHYEWPLPWPRRWGGVKNPQRTS